MNDKIQSSALLVADAPGHILETIGRSWQTHARPRAFDVVCSSTTHPFLCNLRRRRYDIIHWIDPGAYQRSARFMRLPQVVSLHHLTEDMRKRLNTTFFHADAIVATARSWQRELSTLSGRNVFFMPYGVDSSVFRFSPDKAQAKMALGIDRGAFVVGFIGKAGADVDNRKGTDLFKNIVFEMKHAIGPATLLIVGPGWDPLAAIFTSAGVRVVRKEYADNRETPAAYAAMDVLLVTSRIEGGPCTILESMATGTPVISSNVGHVPETITDGETGFVCPNRTVQEYLDKLRLLYADSSLRQRLIAAGRAYIEAERDDTVLVKTLPFEECYASAVQHHGQRSIRDRLLRLVQQPVFALRFAGSSLQKRREHARQNQ